MHIILSARKYEKVNIEDSLQDSYQDIWRCIQAPAIGFTPKRLGSAYTFTELCQNRQTWWGTNSGAFSFQPTAFSDLVTVT